MEKIKLTQKTILGLMTIVLQWENRVKPTLQVDASSTSRIGNRVRKELEIQKIAAEWVRQKYEEHCSALAPDPETVLTEIDARDRQEMIDERAERSGKKRSGNE